MGTLVSALGVILSVKIDTATGATMVLTLGGVLTLMFFFCIMDATPGSWREQRRRVMKFSCGLLQPATTMSIEV